MEIYLDIENLKEWHKIFLWFPKKIDGRYLWLKTIDRRISFYQSGWAGRIIEFEYKG